MISFYDKRRMGSDTGWILVRKGELKAECEGKKYD